MVAGNTCQDKMNPACSPPNTHTTPPNKSSFTHELYQKTNRNKSSTWFSLATTTARPVCVAAYSTYHHQRGKASQRGCCLLLPTIQHKASVWFACSNSVTQVPIPLWPLGTHSCCTHHLATQLGNNGEEKEGEGRMYFMLLTWCFSSRRDRSAAESTLMCPSISAEVIITE